MKSPQVGEKAPDFSLVSQSGENVKLSDFIGKKNVVLYFYPKDFTMGCTAEAKAFKENYGEFTDNNTEVIGVSADSIETHRKFSQECKLPFQLLSDSTKGVRSLYGVNSILGMSGRVTFVIDMNGMIRSVFSSQLQPTRHAREALDALKQKSDATAKVT
jgi:peroxiredoxin Q/BCP